MTPKKNRSVEQFLAEKLLTVPDEKRDQYGLIMQSKEEIPTEAVPKSARYQAAPGEMKEINVDGALLETPKTGVKETIKKSLQETAPIVTPPAQPAVKPEAPMPTGTRQYVSPELGANGRIPGSVTPAQDSSPWERAMIGATPLLVGLLSGNTLEGTQTSANYFVNEESDRYKRTKDFNNKLAEMQAKKDLQGSVDGKIVAKEIEYQGSDGLNRIGRMVNGRHHIDEVNDPLAPKKATAANKPIRAKVASKTHPGEFDEVAFYPDTKQVEVIGQSEPNDNMQALPVLKDDGTLEYAAFSHKSGDAIGTGLKAPQSKKGGLSLEERVALAKYNRDLKESDIKFKQVRDLNKDRESLLTTKNTRELSEAHGKIMEASFGKDPITDVATIFALFKMMDPGSVVRESEQALGVGARSYQDLVDNVGPVLMRQRYLTPKQVVNIRNLAQKMYQNQLKMQKQTDAQYIERAKQYGLDPVHVAPPITSPYVEKKAVPKTIKQGDHVYKLNEATGEYE